MGKVRLSYANVMATIAVFVALGGGAYAAVKLPRNSVGSKQLKRNAVTSRAIKDGAVQARDLAKGVIPAGGAGPVGPTGPKGETGPAGPAGSKGDQGEPRFLRTVVVSPAATPAGSGGALRAALAGITDATAARPVLLKLEPGTYDLQATGLTGKANVDIEGSGTGRTVIECAAAVCLSPAGGTEVRFATVHAVGDSHDAVHLGGSDTTIRDAALTADAGFALSVTAGTGNRVLTSTLNAATPWFSVVGSSGTAVAIHNSFLHGDITLNAAVLALRSTEVIGDNLQAVIFAAGGATAYVEDSAVIGDFMEISGAGSKVRIGASRLEIPSGIITDAGGSAACVASYDASFAPLGC